MAGANALFAVFGVTNPSEVEAKLENIAPWLHLPVDPGQWLIIAPVSTTTKEVSDRLGFLPSSASNGIVVRVESYFGKKAPSIWEWIAAKQGAELVAHT